MEKTNGFDDKMAAFIDKLNSSTDDEAEITIRVGDETMSFKTSDIIISFDKGIVLHCSEKFMEMTTFGLFNTLVVGNPNLYSFGGVLQ